MPKRRQPGQAQETAAGLRMDYIMEAAWFWVRAESAIDNLQSALHRELAGKLAQRFRTMGWALPTPDETYAYAIGKWPEHRLHTAPPKQG